MPSNDKNSSTHTQIDLTDEVKVDSDNVTQTMQTTDTAGENSTNDIGKIEEVDLSESVDGEVTKEESPSNNLKKSASDSVSSLDDIDDSISLALIKSLEKGSSSGNKAMLSVNNHLPFKRGKRKFTEEMLANSFVIPKTPDQQAKSGGEPEKKTMKTSEHEADENKSDFNLLASFICGLCKQTFASKIARSRHLRIEHNTKASSLEKFTFDRNAGLLSHLNATAISNEKSFKKKNNSDIQILNGSSSSLETLKNSSEPESVYKKLRKHQSDSNLLIRSVYDKSFNDNDLNEELNCNKETFSSIKLVDIPKKSKTNSKSNKLAKANEPKGYKLTSHLAK